jgi:hypothetical protein
VAPKSTALCKATRSKEALLQGLQKMMKLTFTWPDRRGMNVAVFSPRLQSGND